MTLPRICTVLAAFVIVTAAAPIAHAQSKRTNAPAGYGVVIGTARSDATYKQGDPVTFLAKVMFDGELVNDGELLWTTLKDGLNPAPITKVKITNGLAKITGKLDEPGFLQCRVVYVSPEKSNFVAIAGAAISPLQIKPSMPEPGDFDAYWAGLKQKLAAVPVNPRLTSVTSPAKEVEAFDLQADCVGKPVSGYFARPVGAKPKSLPIILTVHGAGVRNSSLGGAVGWAKQSFLAMDINAHGIPNGKPDTFYSELSNGELKGYPTSHRESRDTIYFQGMFLRLVRAIDFLTAQPEWDGRTVIVHGSSQGGYQSIVAAGLDPRVTFYAAGVPAGCDHTGFKVGRINGWPKFIGTEEKNPDAKVVEAVRYYDAMNFATRVKVPGIMTVGFIDTTCPPSSVYATFNAMGGKKEIFDDPASTHTVTPAAGDAMRKAILKHAEEMRKRL